VATMVMGRLTPPPSYLIPSISWPFTQPNSHLSTKEECTNVGTVRGTRVRLDMPSRSCSPRFACLPDGGFGLRRRQCVGACHVVSGSSVVTLFSILHLAILRNKKRVTSDK
jgi:hypothetical protein